jgi:hypothetical protein
VAWSLDGRRLASTTWDSSVSVWDGGSATAEPTSRIAEAHARVFGRHLAEAEAAAAAGQVEAVRFHVDRIRAKEPPDSLSLLRRATLRSRLGESAETDFARWIEADDPDDGPGWLAAARSLLARGDIEAYERFRASRLPKLTPPSHQRITWQAVRAMALAPKTKGDAKLTLAAARLIPPYGSQATRIEATLALALHRAGFEDEALAHAKAAEKDPSQAPFSSILQALIARRTGAIDEARRRVEEADRLRANAVRRSEVPLGLANEEWADLLILLAEAAPLKRTSSF